MHTFPDAFTLCEAYLRDREGTLPEGLIPKVRGALRARDLRVLSGICDYLDEASLNVESMRTCRQIAAFFKKNADYADDVVCRQAALDSFLNGEKNCRITNKRLTHYYVQQGRLAPDLDLYMRRMETYIKTALGSFDSFLSDLPKRLRVTDGATATRKKLDAKPFLKVTHKPSCTPGAVPYLDACAKWYGFKAFRPITVLYNRVVFVSKNWKTHRSIAGEPDGNMPLQLAFDDWAKESLKKFFRIDLSSQLRNQMMAVEGSVSGSHATIDLKNASNSVSRSIVAWLFPTDWHEYLDAIRSPTYVIQSNDGKPPLVGSYAMFSSMGNGATFGIETLVFAAACKAVGAKDYSVYGDDIIIETELVDKLLRLLTFVGFQTNKDKSFTSGPFRESCGVDAFEGTNVTPVYVKGSPATKAECCHYVNELARIASPEGKLWELLADYVVSGKLGLSPYMEDSMSGVHVDVQTAYDLHLFRRERDKEQRMKAKRYKKTAPEFQLRNHATKFLWCLDKHREALSEGQRPNTDRRTGLGVLATAQRERIHSESAWPVSIPKVCEEEARSWFPVGTSKTKWAWGSWYVPATSVPIHLYWWSDYLVEKSAK